MSRKTTVLLDHATRVVVALFIIAIVTLPFVVPLDGKPHSDFFLLFGRLHPVLLHVPVALLGLVPLLELAGAFKRWRHLRDFAGIALAIGAGGCVPAMLAGYSLAYASGFGDKLTLGHMWGGIALTAFSVLSLLVRRSWIHGRVRFVYPVMILLTAGTLGWAAHQGGSLSHGEAYLTDPLPASVKKLFGIPLPLPDIRPAPDSAYTLTVEPIIERHCLECHNAQKVKGGLRLDSFSRLMKGGTAGPAIVAGDPAKSELLRRVALAENDKQVMPPDGKPLLSADEIAALTAWIKGGASPDAPPATGIVVPKKKGATTFAPVGDYTALRPEIPKVERRLGIRIVPVSQIPGDGLILRTRSAVGFDDAALASLKPFAPYIVDAELAGTKLTDDAFETLASFKNLRALRLENTGVTGAGLAKITGIKTLTYLNLSGTKITAGALQVVSGIRNLYTFDTPATPAPVAPPEPVKPAPAKPAATEVALDESVFKQSVAPILAQNCVSCHGETKVKGGLRLDSLAGLLKGGRSGPVVGADPAHSEIIRLTSLAETEKKAMPPRGKPRLTKEALETLRAWLATAK